MFRLSVVFLLVGGTSPVLCKASKPGSPSCTIQPGIGKAAARSLAGGHGLLGGFPSLRSRLFCCQDARGAALHLSPQVLEHEKGQIIHVPSNFSKFFSWLVLLSLSAHEKSSQLVASERPPKVKRNHNFFKKLVFLSEHHGYPSIR